MIQLSGLAGRWYAYRPSKLLLLAACLASFAASGPVGLVSGGWVTAGRAKLLSEITARDAQADLAATVCVNRFLAAPDAASRLDVLRQNKPWYRSVMLENSGWSALPGMPNLPGRQEPVDGAAELCAHRLMAMTPPSPHVAALADPPPHS